jgi:hypothetical protein
VNDLPLAASEEERRTVNAIAGQFDAPAYVRRARNTQAAIDQLLDRCRQQRDEWLLMPRLRAGYVVALAWQLENLAPHLADAAEVDVVRSLVDLLQPKLRVPIAPTTALRRLRRALHDLTESLNRFNARWLPYLRKVDCGEVNKVIADYNRYYVLEKECVVRSARLARHGFQPAPFIDADFLIEQLPPLPVPRIQP